MFKNHITLLKQRTNIERGRNKSTNLIPCLEMQTDTWLLKKSPTCYGKTVHYHYWQQLATSPYHELYESTPSYQ